MEKELVYKAKKNLVIDLRHGRKSFNYKIDSIIPEEKEVNPKIEEIYFVNGKFEKFNSELRRKELKKKISDSRYLLSPAAFTTLLVHDWFQVPLN